MQSELPIALNVFHTDYLLEYSESYSGISTVLLYEEPLSHSYLKTTPISY